MPQGHSPLYRPGMWAQGRQHTSAPPRHSDELEPSCLGITQEAKHTLLSFNMLRSH